MPDKDNTSSSYWKKAIFAIDDRKLLNYIQDQIRLRLDHDRAEENLEKSEKKIKSGKIAEPYGYKPPRNKLKPMSMEMLSKAGEDKEEAVY